MTDKKVINNKLADVDPNMIIEVLNNSLDDFAEYARYINDYLNNN